MSKFFSITKISIVTLLVCGLLYTSCDEFLDIVPDNVFQYENFYDSQNSALHALSAVYLSSPYNVVRFMPFSMGDEWAIANQEVDNNRIRAQGISYMRGFQSASNPLMSLWTGNNYFCNLYVVIRDCDMFILNIDRVPDMSVEMKNQWKGQALFMKAYSLFMLLKAYGPIVLPKTVDPGELNSDLYLPRSKVEDCFDKIISLLDEAIPLMKGKTGINDLGQADMVTAKAIKARVLLHRASPFYNGNSEYYGNFLNHNGEHFFSQTYDPEKWKAAAEAAQEALDACEQWGFRLYHNTKRPYDYDQEDYELNPERMKILYDLRLRISERWNEELIWGATRLNSPNFNDIACIKKPAGYGGIVPDNDGLGWGGASYQAMERYYTERGLPLEEDRNVNLNTLHDIVVTPSEFSPEYAPMRGIMQPNVQTINMYLGRELRFYADLGITGGYYRSHQVRIRTQMFQGTDGGYNPATYGTEPNPTGIAVQKTVNPEEYFQSYWTSTAAPSPIIRVADLYLMKAEALNEYYGPSQEVYDAINAVRIRAGIPTVEESYSNPEWVTDEALNKHLTKEGMREIILRERANELSFEFGHRFWDMQRWKRSITEFSRPIYGWNYLGTNATSFFNHTIVQGRKWNLTSCLWPIDIKEMERNPNLIQNPGW
ncbi:MAG: RagB/SusD family nutrient uptake outer membrane protein [Fermentimonas sp.]|jgi:hypothetical protein